MPADRKPEKTKTGSVAGAVGAFAAVGMAGIEPPRGVKLRRRDRAVWQLLMLGRAREEWSDVDLYHAANLTRCMSDIERMSAEIEKEGDVLPNGRGTMVANPKHALLETLSRRAVALTRLLHLHAAVLQGRPADVVPARVAEKAARAASAGDEDDLLATPMGRPPTSIQ